MPRLFTGLEIPAGVADNLSRLRGGWSHFSDGAVRTA